MTEMIRRACGHEQPFIPKGDIYDNNRRAHLALKLCLACRKAKDAQEEAARLQERAVRGRIKKGSEPKALPQGSEILIRRTSQGWWGQLTANGVTVEAVTAGCMGIVSKLARKWLQAAGRKLEGKVTP